MSVPVFFTKEDFYGILLPGYATIILSGYFFNFIRISDEISATVLFIVEGPVIGYVLYSFTSFFSVIFTSLGQRYEYEKFREDFAEIRIKATEKQTKELDETLSAYQFCISSGSAFVILSLIKIIVVSTVFSAISSGSAYFIISSLLKIIEVDNIFSFLTLLGGLVLLFNAKYEYQSYHYIFWELYDEIIGSNKCSSESSYLLSKTDSTDDIDILGF